MLDLEKIPLVYNSFVLTWKIFIFGLFEEYQ